jgi:uncharacterized protein YhfF
VTLPVDGAYLVVVNPATSFTGSAVVHLYDVVDVTTPIVPDGTTVPVDVTVPGRNTRLPFTGSAGQRMSVWVTVTGGALGCVWYTEIRRADTDGLVGNPAGSCGSSGFLDPVTLPVDGAYVVVLNPAGSASGTATVRLSAVVDVTGAITPGQAARLTFTGTTGQRISASNTVTSGGLGCSWKLQILKPDATLLGEQASCGTTAFREPLLLPATGTYTVVVDPLTYFTGAVSVTAFDVPPDVVGTLTLNAPPVSVSLTGVGQNARPTFAGTQGQPVTVQLTGNTIGGITYVHLLRPNGTTQATGGSAASSFTLSTQTLQTTGTYTVVVDPTTTNVGGISVQVTSP